MAVDLKYQTSWLLEKPGGLDRRSGVSVQSLIPQREQMVQEFVDSQCRRLSFPCRLFIPIPRTGHILVRWGNLFVVPGLSTPSFTGRQDL